MVTSNWYMPECFQTMFYWYINSSPEACVHSIVEFPTFLTERFPELAGGDFELQDARLIKYENMNSYDDYLEVIYSPDEYFFSTFIDYRERRYNYLNSRQNENIVPNRLLRR